MICLRFVYLYNISVEKLTVLCEWMDFFSVQAAAKRQSDQIRWVGGEWTVAACCRVQWQRADRMTCLIMWAEDGERGGER